MVSHTIVADAQVVADRAGRALGDAWLRWVGRRIGRRHRLLLSWDERRWHWFIAWFWNGSLHLTIYKKYGYIRCVAALTDACRLVVLSDASTIIQKRRWSRCGERIGAFGQHVVVRVVEQAVGFRRTHVKLV